MNDMLAELNGEEVPDVVVLTMQNEIWGYYHVAIEPIVAQLKDIIGSTSLTPGASADHGGATGPAVGEPGADHGGATGPAAG